MSSESQTLDLTVAIFPFLAPAALDALYGPLVVELGRELDLTTIDLLGTS